MGGQYYLTRNKSFTMMSALTLLTEASKAAKFRCLEMETHILVGKLWARNSLKPLSPFIPHAKVLDDKSDLYEIFIMVHRCTIAGQKIG
jgi:hypothetical protein